ncbi:hypothetical protein BDA99DRAFT_582532 [Phascolomyces articulosus]|uniref:Uncharacterized protein n=1 Tax=Phascolomyces articulosus TaxID=60185 RepID=A0AAD5JYW2_9FUNG|nr:hypothetical protein BDA99DRAFT_582532 [Phascolomyces articulosus]
MEPQNSSNQNGSSFSQQQQQFLLLPLSEALQHSPSVATEYSPGNFSINPSATSTDMQCFLNKLDRDIRKGKERIQGYQFLYRAVSNMMGDTSIPQEKHLVETGKVEDEKEDKAQDSEREPAQRKDSEKFAEDDFVFRRI